MLTQRALRDGCKAPGDAGVWGKLSLGTGSERRAMSGGWWSGSILWAGPGRGCSPRPPGRTSVPTPRTEPMAVSAATTAPGRPASRPGHLPASPAFLRPTARPGRRRGVSAVRAAGLRGAVQPQLPEVGPRSGPSNSLGAPAGCGGLLRRPLWYPRVCEGPRSIAVCSLACASRRPLLPLWAGLAGGLETVFSC